MFDLLEDMGLNWDAFAPSCIALLSRRIHNAIWQDMDQSLCARAVWKDWKRWQAFWGKRHCQNSFDWYHGHAARPANAAPQ